MKLAVSAIVSTFIIFVLSAPPCRASTFQLGITGDVQVGQNFLDFGQYPNGAPYTPAPGYGSFEVSLVNSGIFSNAGVTIPSLNQGTGPVILPSAFMTFDTGGSNLSLDATFIPAGTAGAYFLAETADGAVLSFNVEGSVKDSSNPTLQEQFTGAYSMTFDGVPLSELFGELPINTPFSATFSVSDAMTTTPEPASSLLMAVGLFGALAVFVRKIRMV